MFVEKVDNCSNYAPPYMGGYFSHAKIWTDASPRENGTRKEEKTSTFLSTGGGWAVTEDMGASVCATPQVGEISGFPHIHRDYYEYYI